MSLNPQDMERCHAAIRETATRFTVEEALHGLAATAAEVIVAGAPEGDSRDQLYMVFATMTSDFLKQAKQKEKWAGHVAGHG